MPELSSPRAKGRARELAGEQDFLSIKERFQSYLKPGNRGGTGLLFEGGMFD